MRVLFLDIDGVLNHGAFFAARKADRVERGVIIVERQPKDDIDPACVERLNRVLDATGAVVVVSSSWRIGHELTEIGAALRAHGFTGEIVGKTPRRDGPRGGEILAWLHAHPHVTRFAIVDDDSDMEPLERWHVKTQFHGGGMLHEHVTALVRLLGVRCVWCDSTGLMDHGASCWTCIGDRTWPESDKAQAALSADAAPGAAKTQTNEGSEKQ